ncbi:hypothetical protein [Caballeronia cordobensis]
MQKIERAALVQANLAGGAKGGSYSSSTATNTVNITLSSGT